MVKSLVESTLNSQQHISNIADKAIVEIQAFCQRIVVLCFLIQATQCIVS